MNPQQTPPATPPNPQDGSSLDYLNQIAPTTAKKSLFGFGGPSGKLMYVLAGLVGVVLVVLVLSLILNAGGGNKTKLEHLAARLNTTATIVGNAEKILKDTKLRTLNGNLTLLLANTNRDIVAPFAKAGVNTAKLPKDVVSKEAATDVTARLEDARLNAVYDSTYAREMAYQLETTLTLMKEIYNSTSSNDLKTFLQTSYDNLQPTQEAFADFDVSTE